MTETWTPQVSDEIEGLCLAIAVRRYDPFVVWLAGPTHSIRAGVAAALVRAVPDQLDAEGILPCHGVEDLEALRRRFRGGKSAIVVLNARDLAAILPRMQAMGIPDLLCAAFGDEIPAFKAAVTQGEDGQWRLDTAVWPSRVAARHDDAGGRDGR